MNDAFIYIELSFKLLSYAFNCWFVTGTCDVQSMTDADVQTSIHLQILLQEGQRYFFTVEATNGAGLKETAYSDGVTVDVTPLLIGDVSYAVQTKESSAPQQSSGKGRSRRSVWDTPADADQSDDFGVSSFRAFSSIRGCNNSVNASCDVKQSSDRLLVFSWEAPTDAESGISSVEWCASSGPHSCDIILWTSFCTRRSPPCSPLQVGHSLLRVFLRRHLGQLKRMHTVITLNKDRIYRRS